MLIIRIYTYKYEIYINYTTINCFSIYLIYLIEFTSLVDKLTNHKLFMNLFVQTNNTLNVKFSLILKDLSDHLFHILKI